MNFNDTKTRKLLFSVAILFLSFSVLAQEGDNLVNNSSFEDAQTNKVRRLGAIDRATGWYSPTKQSADLFVGDSKTADIQTPQNVYGNEDPKDGMNYAGIIAYSYRGKLDRSYLTTKLKSPLVKGAHYKIQFYASLADMSKYACNRLGVHFSKKSPDVTSKKVPALILSTDLEHPKKEVFDGRFGWDLVCGEYVATGKEKYLTIGVFVNDDEIKTMRMRKERGARGTQVIAAYYYIDDVSIQLLGDGEKCKCKYPDQFQDKTYTLYQRSPQVNDTMSFENRIKQYQVYYASGRYDLRKNGENTIATIADILKKHPEASIQITGHADAKEAMNAGTQDVSQKRADLVKSKLVEQGIAKDRLITEDVKDKEDSPYIGSGDDEKLVNAKNRRVSFTLIK